ncbi:MAG: alcohol dehydrogenase catalytic domain-containing protein, partial [bacterium]
MKVAVLEKIRNVSIEEREIPKPKEDEVLVRIKSVGVCGSDIHYYNEGRIGSFVVEKPIILGHESSGEVVEVGSKVKSLKVGDRVALEPGIPCRKCNYCKTGRYNLCPDVVFMATPPVDGAFAEYVVHPEDFAFKLPDNVSYDEGALMEPLSVGIYASNRARV